MNFFKLLESPSNLAFRALFLKKFFKLSHWYFVLHVETNDLISNTPPAGKLKSEKCDVTVSEIILRTDKPYLNKKGNEVNTHLKEMCKEKNIFLIDHGKKIKANYLNSSKLHLNRRGARILSTSFLQHISKVFK